LARVTGRKRLVEFLVKLRISLRVGVVANVAGNRLAEGRPGFDKMISVLRPLRSGYRRHHLGQVELQVFRERRLVLGVVPQALLFGVGLDQRQLIFLAAGVNFK